MKYFVIFCCWFTAISFLPVARDMTFFARFFYALIATGACGSVCIASTRGR